MSSSRYQIECGECGLETDAKVASDGSINMGVDLNCGHHPGKITVILDDDDPNYRRPLAEVHIRES